MCAFESMVVEVDIAEGERGGDRVNTFYHTRDVNFLCAMKDNKNGFTIPGKMPM